MKRILLLAAVVLALTSCRSPMMVYDYETDEWSRAINESETITLIITIQ